MVQIPRFEVEFTKNGLIFDRAQVDALTARVADLTDLLIFSHGWNNDIADARQLSNDFIRKAEEVIGEDIVPEVAGRTFAAVIVLWPSKKFTDQELIPGGGAASLGGVGDDSSIRHMLEELKNDPDRLGVRNVSPVREGIVNNAIALLPKLEQSAEARSEFVFLLRALMSPNDAHDDDGTLEFFLRPAEEIFQEMSKGVVAPVGPGAGGSASLSGGSGGAAGLQDALSGILGAARRIANFTTYYQMKERAGTVGRTGLSQVIRQLRVARPGLKLHLIGHSFGGRVVTAAADSLDDNTKAITMTLLQAAYSHNGLAEKFDAKNDGFFRNVISRKRVAGPILITHTKNDLAVGVAYPLASRLSHTKASAFGDENDPYGGIGRNGAQFTPEAKGNAQMLAELPAVQPGPYKFVPGAVYNLKADLFIKDHSDICKHQVAFAMLKAAGTV